MKSRVGQSGRAAAVVTTAASGDRAEALAIAARFDLCPKERAGRPLQQILRDAAGAPVLVLAARRADLYLDGRAFRAALGMAYLRLLRARKGEVDPLVAAAKLRKGDRVLDATLGLGGDALIAAHAAQAPVIAVERSPVLAAFTCAALRRLPRPAADAAELVRIECTDSEAFLRAQPASTFDVVLFDPMFRKPGRSTPLFDDVLRALADPSPLRAETLEEARRVARRGVLVKDAAQGAELQRLGLTPERSRRSAAIAFGWAPAL